MSDTAFSATKVATAAAACRREGTTIRRLPDCLIAAVAMRNRVDLLHWDSAFDAIARHAPLSTVTLTPRAS